MIPKRHALPSGHCPNVKRRKVAAQQAVSSKVVDGVEGDTTTPPNDLDEVTHSTGSDPFPRENMAMENSLEHLGVSSGCRLAIKYIRL